MRAGPNSQVNRRRFFRRWVGWVSLGETMGFLARAAAQFLAAARWPPARYALRVLAGAIEGAVLGWFQAKVLRTELPGVSVRNWAMLTAAAAAAAWTLGLLPSSSSGWQAWPVAAQLAAGGLAATALLTSIGWAQWFELRKHVPGAWRWIAGSPAAWTAGWSDPTAAPQPT